jgi:hypothetical protein
MSDDEDDAEDNHQSRSVSKALARLRKAGWMVAVHNDYNLNGKWHTFWLFTHQLGLWCKGEGRSDRRALAQAEAQMKERSALMNVISNILSKGRISASATLPNMGHRD